ncbi:MAG: ABC transporter ATP-binding protein [Candidatus Eremiobacteraeota bacterium]|nr:ABC transporter ATP-binding protein [Candidatus Eremiobacteraeota bacterium]
MEEARVTSESGLAVSALGVRYGGVIALADVSLAVPSGGVVGLIGPNGAGKTTVINAVTGVRAPDSGTIALDGVRLDRLSQHRVARAGVARTYQNIRLFAQLGVADNVRAGAYRRTHALSDGEVVELLERTGTRERNLARRAGTLPYGEQRRLEIARALAAQPSLVLLDEPAAGMNPSESLALRGVIRDVARAGAAVLLVEHDMSLVGAVCDRVVVLNFGAVIAAGSPAEIARDPAVIEAYLGTEA